MTPILAGLNLDGLVGAGSRYVDPAEFARKHQQHLEIARDALLESRAAAADALSKNVRDPKFQIGDLVLLSTENFIKSRRQHKLRHHWVGPFKVRAVFKNGVEIDLAASGLSSRLSTVWSNTYIKRYITRAPHGVAPLESDIQRNAVLTDNDLVENDYVDPQEVVSAAEFFNQSEYMDESVSSSEDDSE